MINYFLKKKKFQKNKNIFKTCFPANVLKEGIYIVQTVQANILL